jgi:hypothetical protein
MRRPGRFGGAALLSLVLLYGTAHAQFAVDVESGIVSSSYNDVRIPGDTGTLFSLSDDLDAKSTVFYRVRVHYSVGARSDISLLVAPLEIRADGRPGKDIRFAGKTFAADVPLDATYRFDSYRLTYRYDLQRSGRLEFGIGLTAKIRDAEVRLSSSEAESKKTNLGFVPLINFRLLWKPGIGPLALLVDGDALAAPQGRAEDVLAALEYALSDRLAVRAGYRILEGGADNDEVYNFTLLNYAVVGLTFRQ